MTGGGNADEPGARARAAAREISRLLNVARETLGMDIAFVTAADDHWQEISYLVGDALGFGWQVGDRKPAGGGPCAAVLSAAARNVCTDASSDVGSYPGQLGVSLGVPLVLPGGRVYGALRVSSREPRPDLGDREIAMLNFLAPLVSAELAVQAEVRAQQQLRHERLADLLHPGRLTTVLQPIVDLTTGDWFAVEALTRFGAAMGPPDTVFASAEGAGLRIALELAALDSALRVLPVLPASLTISVNASPATVVDDAFGELFDGVDRSRVIVEITEYESFDRYPQLFHRIQALQGRSIRVALDDAGSGYAGLQTILALRPDIIKLDIGLVTGMDHDAARRSLVRAMVSFARETSTTLVAEGIQNAAEADALQMLGVQYGQGFHLVEPMSVAQIVTSTVGPD